METMHCLIKPVLVFGLCIMFGVAAYAGDSDDRICEVCDVVDDIIVPTYEYQVVTGTTAGMPNSDYAYSFCAVAGGFYRFTFCEGGGWANFSTALSVQGPDNCGPYIECNDDYCGLQSQVDFVSPMDATYIVVVDAYSGTGNYGLAYNGPDAGGTPADSPSWGEIKAMYR